MPLNTFSLLQDVTQKDSPSTYIGSGPSPHQTKYRRRDFSCSRGGLLLSFEKCYICFIVPGEEVIVMNPPVAQLELKSRNFIKQRNEGKVPARSHSSALSLLLLSLRSTDHQEDVVVKMTVPCFKHTRSLQGGLQRSVTAWWRKQWEPVTQPSGPAGWQPLLADVKTFLLSTFLIKMFDYKIKLQICQIFSPDVVDSMILWIFLLATDPFIPQIVGHKKVHRFL